MTSLYFERGMFSFPFLALYGIITARTVMIPGDRHFPPRLRREPENMANLYHSLALYGII